MQISLPNLSLVVLIGPSGSGKSTFARKHFRPTEVLSSDFCRGLVSDDENDQAATTDAFDVLHYIARKRLAAGRLTVIDATNVQREARQPLVQLARDGLAPVGVHVAEARPAGAGILDWARLVTKRTSSSSSSSQQPWTSPRRSNGPCSTRRSATAAGG